MTSEFTEQFARLEEMYAPEDLNPELALYRVDGHIGPMIHHPLLIEIMYNPISNRMLNRRFKHKKEMLTKALESQQWDSFIFIHERPYRIDALEEVLWQQNEGDPKNWNLIHSVWTDSENIFENFDRWRDIWNADIPNRHEEVMSIEERLALENLPQEIIVYRGFNYEDAAEGMSWTVDKNKAEWFSKRFADKDATPRVAVGTVLKEKVLAYSMARSESEIIAFPENVKIMEIM